MAAPSTPADPIEERAPVQPAVEPAAIQELPPLEETSVLRRWLTRVIVLAVVGGLAFLAWRRFRPHPVPSKVPVSEKVDRGTIEETVSATGTVQPVNEVDVGSQVSGTIAEILTDRNRSVKAGDVIARIESSRFEAALSQARAAASVAEADINRASVGVREAQQNLARTKLLLERGAGAAAENDTAQIALDRARADLRASQARAEQAYAAVRSAKVDLDHTTIRAPIDGVVIKRSIDAGQTVAASFQAPVLFQIAQDLSEMEVHAAVDQADIGKLHKGQFGSFTVSGAKDPFDATVYDIWMSPTVTGTVVTYDVILRVKNPEGQLLPQMTATVKITAAKAEGVLRVPNAALRFKPPRELLAGAGEVDDKAAKGPRKPKVFVRDADGKHVHSIPVETGIADESFTEIKGGALKEGDEVVVDLRSPDKVPPARRNAVSGARRIGR